MATEKIVMGSVLSLFAFFFVAIMGALAKYANPFFPTIEIVFFQNFISFILLIPLFVKGGAVWRTQRIGMHIFRAISGSGCWFCLFFAFKYTSLTEATLLTYSAPLWLPVIGFLFLKENIPAKTWLGVIVGFIGIIFVLHPSSFLQSWTLLGSGMALFASLLLTFGLLSVRWLKSTEPNVTILFYYFALSSLFFFICAVFNWHLPQEWHAWAALIAIGVCSALAQMCIIQAYHHASPAKLGATVYSVIVFTAVIDWLVWHNALNLEVWLGMILVIIGGLISSVVIKKHIKSAA